MSVHDASDALPRVRLQTAAAALRAQVTRPTGGDGARDALVGALEELSDALAEHVRDAEADDGFLARVLADAPWLAPRAEALRREHGTLTRDCAALVTHSPHGELTDLHRDAERLARRADDHHHRGTAFLLDAYEVDIPAGD